MSQHSSWEKKEGGPMFLDEVNDDRRIMLWQYVGVVWEK